MTERHTEIRVTAEGLSATMYEGDRVVDEMWVTWGELGLFDRFEGEIPEGRWTLG